MSLDMFEKRSLWSKLSRDDAIFAEVYRTVRDDNLPVVLKEINLTSLQDKLKAVIHKDEYLRLTKDETAKMKLLRHQNIVELLDEFMVGNTIYCVLEYCNGGSFQEIIDDLDSGNKAFTSQQLLDYSWQLSCAINFIHKKGIYHRDLKSEVGNFNIFAVTNDPHSVARRCLNVFLVRKDNRSGQPLVKLGDFGLAKATTDNLASQSPKNSVVFGNVAHKAPEYLPHTEYTDRMDMWGFGVILHHWVTFLVTARVEMPERDSVSEEMWLYWQLISGLIKNDPVKRLTSSEVLKHSCFDDRSKALEDGLIDRKMPPTAKTEDNFGQTYDEARKHLESIDKPPDGVATYLLLPYDTYGIVYIGDKKSEGTDCRILTLKKSISNLPADQTKLKKDTKKLVTEAASVVTPKCNLTERAKIIQKKLDLETQCHVSVVVWNKTAHYMLGRGFYKNVLYASSETGLGNALMIIWH